MYRALSLALVAIPAVAVAQTPTPVTEWVVPFRMDAGGMLHDEVPGTSREGTRPRDPYVHPDGRVFFCGQQGNYIGSLDPQTGVFRRYELAPGTHPHNLIIDANGMVWYAGNRNSHIGKLDPESGEITRYPMPDPAVRDPHTLIWDRNGDIWFTAQQANVVGKLTVSSGNIRIIEVPTRGARPYGVVMDAAGRAPWVALFGTNKLATVDPVTMEMREIELPRAAARPRRLAVTTDGAVWYVDYAGGRLGRYDPASGVVNEWLTPGGEGSRPYAMTVDDADRLWFFEGPRATPVRLVGFDSEAQQVVSLTELESGPGTVRHMMYDGASGTIWFGADANTIGRVSVPPGGAPLPMPSD